MSLAAGRAPAATGGSGPDGSQPPGASSAAPATAASSPAERTDVLLRDVAELAAVLCGAVGGGVVMADAGRHAFRARTGGLPSDLAPEDPISPYVVAGDCAVVVPDLGQDPRFADGSLTRAGWRSYAGVPVRSAAGPVVGTLCVLDSVSRDLTADQLDGLHRLARLAAGHLELERTATELSEQEDAQERRDAELAAANRLLSGLLDNADALISVRDTEGRFLLANPALERLTDPELGPLSGLMDHDVFPLHGEGADARRAHEREVIASGRPLLVADVVPHPDGTVHDYLTRTFPLRDSNGELYAVAGMSVDVTPITEVRDRLIESEQKWRRLLEQAPVGLIEADTDGVVLTVNPRLCKLLGRTEEEMIGQTIAEVTRPTAAADQATALADVVSGRMRGYVAKRVYTNKNGAEIPVHVNLVALRDENGQAERLLAVITDRSMEEVAKVTMESALAQLSRERDSASALLAALSHGYIYTVDDGVIAEVNDALCELTGFSRSELVGAAAPYPFWPKESAASYVKTVRTLRAEEGGETELEFVRKDGSRFTAGLTLRAVRNSEGDVTGFVSLAHDVTARRAEEAAVAASEHLLAEAQRQAQVGSWSLDLTTSTLTWSDQMFVLVGIKPRSITPSPADFLTRVHPDDLRSYRDAFEHAVRTGGRHVFEHRIVRPDGTVRHVYGTAEVESHPVTGRAIQVRGSAQDVTDAHQREADLAAQAEKLTAIGKASHAVLTDPNPRRAICAAARTVSGAISVTLLEVSDGVLVPTAADGVEPSEIRRSLDDPRSMLVRVQRSGLPIMIDDTERHEITELPGARAAIVVPVFAAGKPLDVSEVEDERPESAIPVVIGVLAVALTRAPQRRVLELLDVLEVLAGEASLAIDRSDLYTKLHSQARTDPLTGLPNRRRWDESAPLELARAARTGNPVSMALIDLDHFKAYNDTHGHAAGDVLLRAVADAWGPQLRVADLLARYGGEEFAVVLPNCDAASAKRLLDRLRESVPGDASCSAGIAEWDGSETTHEVLERADAALYRAKGAGRNCVIIATDEDVKKD